MTIWSSQPLMLVSYSYTQNKVHYVLLADAELLLDVTGDVIDMYTEEGPNYGWLLRSPVSAASTVKRCQQN